MKKKTFAWMVILCAICVPNTTHACSICGCAAGGNFLGVLPQYQKHFLGMRYNYRSFNTTHPASIIPGMSGRKSTETFQSAELAARFCPGKRWQLFGILPYQFLQQSISGTTTQKSGIGDAQIMGYFSVVPGAIREGKKWRHLLQMGGGLKLPTGGHTRMLAQEGEYNPAFQLGSGSLDPMLSAIYTASAGKWGLNADATLALNGKNPDGYRFGKRISSTIRIYYALKKCKSTWMFHAGMYGEHSAQDYQNEKAQSYTGGTLLMPVIGADRYAKKWGMGANYRRATFDNMQGGYVKSNGRLFLSVYYLF